MGWDIPQETTPHTEGEMAFRISVVTNGILLHSLEPQLAGLVVAIVKMSFCPS